jgi:pyridoxal phosphate enzyme (YggS family)
LSKARALGLTDLGENKVQEAIEKHGFLKAELEEYAVRLHMIGHLQSNKVKRAAEIFNCIDTIDYFRTAEAVDKAVSELGKRMRLLIQVNTSYEPQKSGIEPARAVELADQVRSLKRVDLQGFMTMGPLRGDERAVRESFRRLRQLRDQVCQELNLQTLPVLSMGMSGDFEWAIEEGATEVRLGTVLWGPREI